MEAAKSKSVGNFGMNGDFAIDVSGVTKKFGARMVIKTFPFEIHSGNFTMRA